MLAMQGLLSLFIWKIANFGFNSLIWFECTYFFKVACGFLCILPLILVFKVILCFDLSVFRLLRSDFIWFFFFPSNPVLFLKPSNPLPVFRAAVLSPLLPWSPRLLQSPPPRSKKPCYITSDPPRRAPPAACPRRWKTLVTKTTRRVWGLSPSPTREPSILSVSPFAFLPIIPPHLAVAFPPKPRLLVLCAASDCSAFCSALQVNMFIANTVQFLNSFAATCDEKLALLHR